MNSLTPKKPKSILNTDNKTVGLHDATKNQTTLTTKENPIIKHDIIPKKSNYPKPSRILRVVSINVNGLRAAERKGFFDWLQQSDADIVCIQESRITHEQWTDKFKPEGWYAHLFAAERAGYAGTAIYSRLPFLEVADGLGFELADSQGRFTQATFDLSAHGITQPISIASLYLPSGSSGEEAQNRKDIFLEKYKQILDNWHKQNKSIIVCGDYNIVHKRIDIKNWSGNQKSSGCLPHERAWLDYIYDDLGYVDSFREVRKDAEVYSWWSNRGQARAKNVGWRIDYQVCSPDWGSRAIAAWVYKDTWFSDHAPVIIDYQLDK